MKRRMPTIANFSLWVTEDIFTTETNKIWTQDNCGSEEAFCTVLDGHPVQADEGAELDLRLGKEKDKKEELQK